jgi:hypothetical protein
MNDRPLDMWVVYDHPTDFPDQYVARRWEVLRDEMPTDDLKQHASLDGLRGLIIAETPCHYRMDRFDGDDPKIVEVWL